MRSGHPVRPRSGEARPGSPGAGRGGVTAPSARPRGMHRGSRGRRRHSQVSCGRTWLGPRTLAQPLLLLSAVPGPRWQRGRRGEARGALAQPGVPLGEPPWVLRLCGAGHAETWVLSPTRACRGRDLPPYLPVPAPSPPPARFCKRCTRPPTFGLRSASSSFRDRAYLGKFRGTGSSGKDD